MLAQSFGAENTTNEADCLTCVEFDQSGQYLATGDAGGRVVLFSRTPQPTKSRGTRKDKETSPGNDERRAKVRGPPPLADHSRFLNPFFPLQPTSGEHPRHFGSRTFNFNRMSRYPSSPACWNDLGRF